MSSKYEEKNGFERKKEVKDSDFHFILKYLRRKIFIPISNFKVSDNASFSQKLTKNHVDCLKKELE